MKKFFDWCTNVLPAVWGVLWMAIITIGSVALLITVVLWLLRVLGVM